MVYIGDKFDFIHHIAAPVAACDNNKVFKKNKVIAIQAIVKTSKYLVQLDNNSLYSLNFLKHNQK